MKRKKQIVIIAHCILNCNAKVEGLATYEGSEKNLLGYLIAKGYGIMQLPCPEMAAYGIKRWGQVKEQYDNVHYRENCRNIFKPTLNQIIDYGKAGYEIKCIIGIDGSPSCGVSRTCSSDSWGGEVGSQYGILEKAADVKMIDQSGIFIEEIKKILDEHSIKIPFLAVNEEADGKENNIAKIINIIKEKENEKEK